MNTTAVSPIDWSGYLPRMPRRHWEGWFVIAIGGPQDDVRWAKVTVFRSRRRVPLAALEGLAAPGHLELSVAFADRVVTAAVPFAPQDLAAGASAFALDLGDALHVRSGDGAVTVDVRTPTPALSASLRARPADRLNWATLPLGLTYFGMHGSLEGSVTLDNRTYTLAGLGVVEHAWGSSVPFNAARLVPGRWHWDVLRFDAADDVLPSAAALWIPLPGSGLVGVRGFARFPGGPFTAARPRGITVLEKEDLPQGRRPLRWQARLTTPEGALEYEARAATPLAPSAPGGGFFGFSFTGRFHPRHGSPQDVQGTGFTECGGRTSHP